MVRSVISAGAGAKATSGMGGRAAQISRTALERYEEATFEIGRDRALTPANPLAKALTERLSADDAAKLTALAARALENDRALVDMVDVGEGETAQHLQVTIVPVNEGQAAFCFVRDLTLDYSLRRALVDSRRRYRDFVEISSDFTWETGPDRKFAFVAPHGALGYSADELINLDPQTLVADTGEPNPLLTAHRLDHHEVWLRRRDGRLACMVVSALPLIDGTGTWQGARGVCRDVSELREREAVLVRVNNRERVLTRIVRAFRDEVNPEAMLAVAAEALAKGLGADYSQIFRAAPVADPDLIEGRTDYIPAAKFGDSATPDPAAILSLFAGGAGAAEVLRESWQVLAAPARYQTATNGVVVLWRNIERGPWTDDDRLLIADIANQIGVTIEQLTHHEHILRISRTDALTGLLNRGAFLDAMSRHLSRLRPDAGSSVLMYVDLDNFKYVNDLRGHQAGDELLVKVRDILLKSTRPTDVVARLGGDEFAVWLVGADLAAGEMRARQILERSKALTAYSGSPSRPLGMSIGIALWQPSTAESVDGVMARADEAMYEAKRGGKGSFHVAPPARPGSTP